MKNKNLEELEEELLKKIKAKEKGKKPKMKVSGKSVFKLAEIIRTSPAARTLKLRTSPQARTLKSEIIKKKAKTDNRKQ